ncbi:tetratricopeptide repeat protein [Trueperella bialowiezensis]|uniref:Thioredoxin n=1 Tax=Trueperella bialowiezensis TaxID=312285 RepID=A0A3S5EW50_9ACTO|nr:tetratricopeptide repeat protein [Trueperella bialowiezensis]VEI13776.1 thioredoxin [Trueperella bialowiezensis]
MSGVYDLSAFQKKDDAGGGDTVPGPYVLAVTAQNLQGVINTSAQLPVIAAFHSDKSQNSQALIGMLSKLVNEHKGRFQLATVDVDENSDVAQAFGVNAVPAAVAILQGQPIPLFQGLPDDAQLTDTIAKILQAASEYGMTGVLDGDADATPPEPEIPPLHKAGLEALEKGDVEAAHAAYSEALAQNPADSEAQTALYQIELIQRIAQMNPDGDTQATQKILTAAQSAPLTDVDSHLKAADLEFSYQRPDAAFRRLIDVIKATSGEEREKARERLLAYFDILGPEQPVVAQARKALANALF